MRYLTTADLLAITTAALGPNTPIRDPGMIASAAHRPRTTAFGEDAYPDLHTKAAAILHSILRNHPLVDGNKRLAWVACRTFLAVNGADFTPDEDAAVDFVMRAAASELGDVEAIAAVLREWTG
ncbi:death-on-curing family protein [Catenulispora acidiphila DSM 44928]|uniref:Death-on-curing family protein n=1 Tax=Catenulispora acidiphila (strain DSM 44928 / JCM 14897 / NBRC 102108 / NRRL B-24433 / ID139908) TaxID=479433 RepID=C7PYW5_CATAD|nr:type II toxin-antitoxin system death-on-curing family toxin [Catenulispora acidiphila]ACU69521.1 death-on-curing family protein [Catenulispora acidiphila DSM 44928]